MFYRLESIARNETDHQCHLILLYCVCGHSARLLWQAKRLLIDVRRAEIDSIMADAFDIADRDRLNKAIGREEGLIGLWQFRRGNATTHSPEFVYHRHSKCEKRVCSSRHDFNCGEI